MNTPVTRRAMNVGLTASVLGVGLAGCGLGGGDSSGGGEGGAGGTDSAIAPPQVDCEIPEENLSADEIDRAGELTGTIRFATQNLKTDFGEFFTGLIEAFEEEHPEVTIEWEDTPSADDFNSRMVSDAQTCVMADVINVPGDAVLALTQANLLMDLDIKAPGIGERFLPDAWEGMGFGPDGHHTALPWYWGPFVQTFNTELMEEAGLDPASPPTTWDEVYEQSLAIADSGGSASALWGNPQWTLVDTWANHGAQIMNEDATAFTFAEDDFVKSWLTQMAELYEAGAIPQDSVTGAPDPGQQYSEGTLVFGSPNASFLRSVRNNSPELYPATDVSPVPSSTGTVSFNPQCIAVSVTTQNAPLALAWADYVTTAENQLAWCKDPGVVIFPSTPESLEDPFFTDVDESDPMSRARKVAAESVPNAVVEQATFRLTGQIQTTIMEALQLAITGQQDPAEALQGAQESMNSLLERVQG